MEAPNIASKSAGYKIDNLRTFEDLLTTVAGFGNFQTVLIIFFMIPALLMSSWSMVSSVFIVATPDHWCKVPELLNSSLSINAQKKLIRPHNNPFCFRYAINYTEILSSHNITINEAWPVQACDQGWMYDTSQYDATAVTEWNMICSYSQYSSLAKSIVFTGNLFGTVVFGYFADKIGRKKTFYMIIALICFSVIGPVIISDFTAFFVFRFLYGFAANSFYAIAYVIILEMVGPLMRVAINGLACSAWSFGLCLLPLIAWLTRNWTTLSIVNFVSVSTLFLYWKFLPESPRWLFSQKRYEEAAVILAKMSKVNKNTNHETKEEILKKMAKFKDLSEKETSSNTENYSSVEFLRHSNLRKHFCLISFCWAINATAYFGLQMNLENLSGNEFLNFFLLSVVEFPSHIVTWIIMDKYGRRWCTVGALSITGISCLIAALFSSMPLVGVIFSIIGKVGASSGFMSIFQQAPELFPTSLRGTGLCLCGTIANLATLTSPYIVYTAIIDESIPFLVFAVLNLTAVFCASFIPETLNRKLPETLDDIEPRMEKFFTCYRRKLSYSQDNIACISKTIASSSKQKQERTIISIDNKGLRTEHEVY